MAKIEIEEADLANYQHLSGVVDTLMKSPDTRQSFLHLAKKANPKLAIPEVDAAAPVLNAIGGINKKVDDFINAQAAKDAKAEEDAAIRAFKNTWTEQETQLRQAGWRTPGIDEVRKFAEANSIADLTIAADAYERRNPQPDPAQSASAGWGLFGDRTEADTFVADMMKSSGNDETRLDQEIRAALNDVRSAR